jgi:putative transposase
VQKAAVKRKGKPSSWRRFESLPSSLKTEYHHLAAPNSIEMLASGIDDYLRYYNHKRIKIGLEGRSPVKYRLKTIA